MTSIMWSEIAEQPQCLAQTIEALYPLQHDIRQLAQATDTVVCYGRGTSDSVATFGRYLIETNCDRLVSSGAPSIPTLYQRRSRWPQTLAVGVSQSGATAEIVECLAAARAGGSPTIAVTNAADSPLAQVADLTLATCAGQEVAVPATKSFTSALVAMAVLASGLAERRPDWLARLGEVAGETERCIAHAREVADQLAELAVDADRVIVTGRGIALSVVTETALKLEETTTRPTRGLSSADLEHGPAAVLSPGALLVVIAPATGPTLSGLHRVAERAIGAGADLIVLGGDQHLAGLPKVHVAAPELPEELAPIPLAAAGQVFAEATARRLGLNPDSPPGLQKVTQTSA